MDNEERKQASRMPPVTQLNQVSSDFAMAMALQEQEREFTALTTIESETDDDDASDEVSDEAFNNNDYEYFQSHDFEAELGFLEDEDSYTDDDDEMDQDEIDVDELTYEDLIALGEFIGEEKRGLSLNEIPRCLHPCKSTCIESKSGIDRCVVCQVEYEEGESMVALSCEHIYHSECISKWLQVKKICPICSTEVSPP